LADVCEFHAQAIIAKWLNDSWEKIFVIDCLRHTHQIIAQPLCGVISEKKIDTHKDAIVQILHLYVFISEIKL
jgi:hypothetical protein